MTAFAYGVHDKLIKAGIDPRLEPDLYYRKIDERVREVFPDKFEAATKPTNKKPATVVAPVSRSTNTGKKVVLSASQQRVAKRLGLTPQQYAQELAKLEAQ